MRFWTIWAMPAMSIKERLKRTRDWAAMTTVSFLPQRVRYWTTMRELAKATRTSRNIPATPFTEILRKLDRPKSMS